MKSPGESIRHAKARGEWAELRFITRALELGFRVAKPWGDSAPYDLATDDRGRFCRVQVKCTIFHRGQLLAVPAAKRRKNAAHGAAVGLLPNTTISPARAQERSLI